MVAKDIFPFATVTGGCEEANFMGFFQLYFWKLAYFWKYVFSDEFGKKRQFHFSFFKVDSQNPKFYLEYLVSYIRHKDFFRPSPSPSRSGYPPGFWNGVDWRARVESRPPYIAKTKRIAFFFYFLKNLAHANQHPILDMRISLLPPSFVRNAQGTPLDSETGWTGELGSNTNLLEWQN